MPSIPGYEVLEAVGRGGMGIVYRARQLSLNRIVALKLLRAEEDTTPEERLRIRREADAVARLKHPHVVQIHEIGLHQGRPFLVLEYLEQGSLARRLDGTPQPPQAAARFVATLAATMQIAHERGIVHRDLKPGNILLQDDTTGTDPSGLIALSFTPKISDFGLAKLQHVGQRCDARTRTGAVLGTPSYMAQRRYANAADLADEE